jgi:aspartokinase
VVLKFGGTSVSSLERWETITAEIRNRRREGLRPLEVCSALSQVSNQLEALLDQASEGGELGVGISQLREMHQGLATTLGVDVEGVCDLQDLAAGTDMTMLIVTHEMGFAQRIAQPGSGLRRGPHHRG